MVIASLLGLVCLSCFWMFTRAVIANEGCSDGQSRQYLEELVCFQLLFILSLHSLAIANCEIYCKQALTTRYLTNV